MEERLIDMEEGLRVKRRTESEDGEETEEELELEMTEEGEEDDEELASLSPEEALAYRRAQEEKQREILEKGQELLASADAHLAQGETEEAEEDYFSAREYLGPTAEVLVGILRAGTAEFTEAEDLDRLREPLDELRVSEVEEREAFSAAYGEAVRVKLEELRAERDPVQRAVEAKRAERREVFGKAYRDARKKTLISGAVCAVCLALALILFPFIYRTSGGLILAGAIASAVIFLCSLAFLLVQVNRFVNAKNRVRMNEDNAYSNEGRKLNALNEKVEFYEILDTIV